MPVPEAASPPISPYQKKKFPFMSSEENTLLFALLRLSLACFISHPDFCLFAGFSSSLGSVIYPFFGPVTVSVPVLSTVLALKFHLPGLTPKRDL